MKTVSDNPLIYKLCYQISFPDSTHMRTWLTVAATPELDRTVSLLSHSSSPRLATLVGQWVLTLTKRPSSVREGAVEIQV